MADINKNCKFLSRVRYDATSSTGVKDLEGNTWEVQNHTKLSNGADPFDGQEAIFVCGNSDQQILRLISGTSKFLNVNVPNFTVATWLKPIMFGGWKAAIFYQFYNALFSVRPNGMGMGSHGSTENWTTTPNEINKWAYYEISFEGNMIRFFKNGHMIYSNANHWRNDGHICARNGDTRIGSWLTNQSYSQNTSKFYIYDFDVIEGVAHTSDYDVPNYAISFDDSGLVTAKTPIDLSKAVKMNGFKITGQEPEKTKRRLLWQVDGVWNKLTVSNGNAALTKVATQTPTIDSVLAEGNTIEEISAAKNIPPFAGKLVYPAVAMFAAADTKSPSLHLEANAVSSEATYSYTDYHEFDLLKNINRGTQNVIILDIVPDTKTIGGGSIDIAVSLKQGEEWTEYMPIKKARMKKASRLKLKAVYSVKTVGSSDYAKLNKVEIKCSPA